MLIGNIGNGLLCRDRVLLLPLFPPVFLPPSVLSLRTRARQTAAVTSLSTLVAIDHLTVACSVTRPLNDSEAEGDLALIETSLVFSCKCT